MNLFTSLLLPFLLLCSLLPSTEPFHVSDRPCPTFLPLTISVVFFLRQGTACYSWYIHHAFIWWHSDIVWFTLYSSSNSVWFGFLCMAEGYTDISAPRSPYSLFFRAHGFCVCKIKSFPHISPFHVCQYWLLIQYFISQSPSAVRTICSSS